MYWKYLWNAGDFSLHKLPIFQLRTQRWNSRVDPTNHSRDICLKLTPQSIWTHCSKVSSLLYSIVVMLGDTRCGPWHYFVCSVAWYCIENTPAVQRAIWKGKTEEFIISTWTVSKTITNIALWYTDYLSQTGFKVMQIFTSGTLVNRITLQALWQTPFKLH